MPFSLVAKADPSFDSQRAELILKAFNDTPSKLHEPLTIDKVIIHGGLGRVDVNSKAKFSYLAQIADAKNPESAILLLPLATSRFTPTYYQTDEWWDANKTKIDEAKSKGLPAPKQDQQEVLEWLQKMKLSTNPDVINIDPSLSASVTRTPLQTFLRNKLIETYAKDGYITLYRGAEKPDELETLQSGLKPKGMRYWTPTANYAWRYARKNQNFLEGLVDGKTPLLAFKVPVGNFIRLLDGRYPDMTLGFELTKNAHQSFDWSGVFKDHLSGTDYSGTGEFAAEIELRANRAGSTEMVSFFSHAVTIEELSKDRVAVLERARDRLVKEFPERAEQIQSEIKLRIDRVFAEEKILVAVRKKEPRKVVEKLLQNLPSQARPEIANFDFKSLQTFVTEKVSSFSSAPRSCKEAMGLR